MNIVGYILVMGFAIVVILILGLFILADIITAKEYRKATRVQGTICEMIGIEDVAFYGKHQYRQYGRYVV